MEIINIVIFVLPVCLALFAYQTKIKRRNGDEADALINRKKLSIELQKRDVLHGVQRSKSALKKKESRHKKRKSVQFNEVVLEVLDTPTIDDDDVQGEREGQGYGIGLNRSPSTLFFSSRTGRPNSSTPSTTPAYPKVIKSSLKTGKINTPLRSGQYNSDASFSTRHREEDVLFPKRIINNDNGYIIKIKEEERKVKNLKNSSHRHSLTKEQIIDINQLRLTPLETSSSSINTSTTTNTTTTISTDNIPTTTNTTLYPTTLSYNPTSSLIPNSSTTTTTTTFQLSNNTETPLTNTNNNNNNEKLIESSTQSKENNSSVVPTLAIANVDRQPELSLSNLSSSSSSSAPFQTSPQITITSTTTTNPETVNNNDSLLSVSLNSLSPKANTLPRMSAKPSCRGHRRQSSVRLKCIY